MVKKTFLTEEGLANLEAELEDLKTTKRKEIAEKIKTAISFGDLSENSEYDEAKNEQAITEARIAEIEATLKNVKIIDANELSTEIVHVGSKVKIQNFDANLTTEYRIVGANEANPTDGKISDDSPVGAALLGHKIGDILDVVAPIGVSKYKILKIYK